MSCHPEHSVPPGDRREFIETAGWRFASTMPEIPHEYTVRGKATGDKTEPPPVEWHDWFVEQIDNYGYRQRFGGRTYTYLEVDGYKYWAISPVINRARLSR